MLSDPTVVKPEWSGYGRRADALSESCSFTFCVTSNNCTTHTWDSVFAIDIQELFLSRTPSHILRTSFYLTHCLVIAGSLDPYFKLNRVAMNMRNTRLSWSGR